LQRVLVGAQSTQLPPTQASGHATPSFVHMPFSLQTWGCFIEHCRVVGEQGEHVPLTQNALGLVHAGPSTHCPIALQVRGVLLLQSFAPGMHAPPHAPLLQTLGHTMPLLAQCPVVSQSCGWLALQRVAPGMHSQPACPTQAPVQTAPFAVQRALALQICGVLPVAQRVAPGVHSPSQEPSVQRKGHAVPLAQLPVLLQVCGVSPLQRVAPGVQSVHWAAMQANWHTSFTVHCPALLQMA
jgi:hypothetical protein